MKCLRLFAPLLLTGCLAYHRGALPNEPKNEGYADIAGARVHYVDTTTTGAFGAPPQEADAKKPAVVLVHGFGASIDEWFALLPVLAKNKYRVLAMDLKGHGWTDRPEGDYTIEAQAKLVLGLIDARGIDKFVVVGHSWGSAVSLELVSMVPKRVERVVLFNGMFFQDQQPALFSWARVPGIGEILYGAMYKEREDDKLAYAVYDKERMVTEAAVESLEEMLDRPGTEASALAGVRQMDHHAIEKKYRSIQQPVLLIWGRDDPVTSLVYGERLLRELPHGRLVVMPLCGHMPMLEMWRPSSDEVLRFLGEQP